MYSLTVKVSIDDSWDGVKIFEDGQVQTLEIKGEAGARYVLLNIVPDTGVVTLYRA